MEFKIVSQRAYSGIINISKFDSIVASIKPLNNQIVGIFAKGRFGNNVNPMLILNSSLSDNLLFDLEIKTSKNKQFQNTSTSSLFKGVKSIEYWPYDIEKIRFNTFKAISTQNFHRFKIEEKTDSTCIKNADKNTELGEEEFKSYLKTIIANFEITNRFKINKPLEYEKLTNSKDVSLGHYWSLGESIYANKKGFKFGNPLSFQKVECPYFDIRTEYFYTQVEREVKVVGFNWVILKDSDIRGNPQNNADLKFLEKYNFLTGVLSDLLGKPLTIEQGKNSGRIDMKWRSTHNINAYLFRFKKYNEIRLYIYKD